MKTFLCQDKAQPLCSFEAHMSLLHPYQTTLIMMLLENMPRFTHFVFTESAPDRYERLCSQFFWSSNIVSDSNEILRDWKGIILMFDNIQIHKIVTTMGTFPRRGFPFIDFGARKDSSFHVIAFLKTSLFKKDMKGKTFIFTEECMKEIVAKPVLSMFSHFNLHPSAELIKVAYKTVLECGTLTEQFRIICN